MTACNAGPQPVMELAARPNKPALAPPKEPPKWRVVAGNLASGAIAGCVVEAALYPLDTIKTRLQMMRSGGGLQALLKSGGGKSLYAGIKCALPTCRVIQASTACIPHAGSCRHQVCASATQSHALHLCIHPEM